MSKAETVFVTGGASGIGLAIVKQVLEVGRRAVIADRDQVNLHLRRQEQGVTTDQGRFKQLDTIPAPLLPFLNSHDAS